MASYGEIPRGIEDFKVDALTAADVPSGVKTDMPGIQTVSFNITSDSDEVKGDDVILATVRSAKKLEGQIGIARINLNALAIICGGTVTTGTPGTPTETQTLNETDAAPSLFFAGYALANSYDASGTAYFVTFKKLTVTSGPDESLAVDEFNSPTIDIEGTGVSGVILTRQLQKQKTAIPA